MASWGEASQSRLIGKRITRLSGKEKVTGKAKYTYDINRPGMLYGRILRSEVPHATVTEIDLTDAQEMPGVRAVMPLIEAGRKIRYQGQEIAAVAAETDDIAKDALRAIYVELEELPFVATEADAMAEGAPQVHDDWNGNQSNPSRGGQGDVEAGFAEAAVTVEATYHTPVQTHVCLETHGHVVEWTDEQNLTVWASTQAVFGVRNDLARRLELPANQVHVITEHMGGGFGSKFSPGVEGLTAARLSRMTERPVKLMLTRKAEHLVAGNRPSMTQHVKAGATRDGRLIAYDMRGHGTGGTGGGAGFTGPYVYHVPNIRTERTNVAVNAGSQRAMRAPGHPQGAFAMDSLMDELAEKLGMNPLEFRRLNDESEVRQAQYTLGAQEIGWHRRNSVAGSGTGIKKRGMGVGSGQWGGGGGANTQARVNINADGTVEAITGTQDLGTGIRTAIAIIVAEEFGLTTEDIIVKIGDSAPGLPAGGSGGSQTTPSVAPVIKTAAANAKQKLFEHVAPLLQAPVDDLRIGTGTIYVASDRTKTVTWQQATGLLGQETISEGGEWDRELRQGGVAGTQFAEVEVDTQTGHVKILKIVAVQDCGLAINRLTTESQINGGVIMGIGQTLLEERIMDPMTGRMLNANLEDYKVPGTHEIPEIKPIVFDTHRKVSGVGEPPCIPTLGAIANAVYNAIGVRIRELPITPDKVLNALAEKA
ncbi:xanthine dehydrogenase family protein molybdopterin-binding subunit [Candidatus Poribacteria bacterium]|nr:xanthine dehydrogenase family protein molybdopterin-binding subunit [Candidatus Poribacteria bacterium]MYB66437.1 xanthine dehydrogenase family protein molybdopterin-binding subunit [Candidatus Poribacteria bacterium]